MCILSSFFLHVLAPIVPCGNFIFESVFWGVCVERHITHCCTHYRGCDGRCALHVYIDSLWANNVICVYGGLQSELSSTGRLNKSSAQVRLCQIYFCFDFTSEKNEVCIV